MKWSDIKSIVGKAAPIVGTLLGGPAGAAVGGLVSTALGVENKPEAVEAELRNNPDALLKLKQYENIHQEKLQEMQLDETKAYLADIQDARNRQAKHEEATGQSDINLYILAWSTVIGFFGLIGTLMFIPMPDGSDKLIYLLLGALTANTNSVYQYFFGTSKGSSDKMKFIANQTKG